MAVKTNVGNNTERKEFEVEFEGVIIKGRVYPSNQDWNYGNVTLYISGLCIEGISIRKNNKNELWFAMPSREVKDGYRNFVYFSNKDFEEKILIGAAEALDLI